ncbi:MAG: bifunctional phosphopantothenoylcysteine decarboxylase/phosphopantothenate--cysteine ligase CoaBC [Nitrospiraceae bacterium]|nr:bifunctional phosphopantothenoylcysteine decarboxylase/phosphopantothenate--cysteine ligase CoaBC [Nitrospirota bacterium]MDA8339448.1 bifunctional phosphopantothenoylcysteine decarboxylase/phosphopantothenate--cysteine ligase CoaBC [Nitrospiraceae bacterium]
MLKDRSILLGITGSVAAYKSIELIKGLRHEGASVKVVMTEASKRFITPLSIELATESPIEPASGNSVYCDMFDSPLSHVSLPADADLFVVAPATANIIGKYANGIADDLLSTALLAFNGKVIIAPAMNWRMYENPVFQKNLQYLVSIGVKTVGPERGSLACGEEGIGRMADIEKIMEAIRTALSKQDIAGEKVLVTAGPTREDIDPVRYISNKSSGKMGYAIAKIAKRRGADVTLISGPVAIKPPDGVDVINVETANEMHAAVMDNISRSSIFVMSAAVADFMPAESKGRKIEKKEGLSLDLIKTGDILEDAGRLKNKPFIVGFAAETGQRLDRARKKLVDKNIDVIVFNDVSKKGSGFDVDTNEVVIIDKKAEKRLPLMSKDDVAIALFDRIIELKYNNG